MNALPLEILILIGLIMANGFFAMAEIAVVSARRERLRLRAEKGDATARLALEMAESPNRFLGTVQIGITLVSVVAGVFGGATLAGHLAEPLAQVPGLAAFADEIAAALVVVGITFLSLVVGELAPKRIGLAHAERIACGSAYFMRALGRIARPLLWLLDKATEALLRLLPVKTVNEQVVTEDEVKGLMREGLRAGAFNRIESQIVSNALDLDQLTVRDIMTPRPKIIWLNKDDSHEAIWHKIVVSRHAQFPVYEGNRDHIVGIVTVKAIYANLAAGAPVRLADLMTKPLIVPAGQPVPKLLETFQQTGTHVAFASDEFGSIVGMVTLIDLMEAILGEMPAMDARVRPDIRQRPDGSWIADALVEIERAEAALPGFRAGTGRGRDYQTLAGFVVKQLGHVPKEGETVASAGYVFEILDMDHHRVDKVLVTRGAGVSQGP